MKILESTASIVIVHPNGIIETKVKPDWDQPDTPETAIDHSLTLKKGVGNNICGILTFLPNLYMKKEVIEAFATVEIGHIAEAFLVNSVGSRILATLALKLDKSSIPRKVFTKKEQAEKWLLDNISRAKQNQQNT
jgi:hypothetical protein